VKFLYLSLLLTVFLTASSQGIELCRDYEGLLNLPKYKLKKQIKKCELECKNGNLQACGTVSLFYLDGIAVKQNEKKAINLAKKSCDKDVSTGCLALSKIYERKRDIKKAILYAEKSCQLTNAEGCKTVARFYGKGIGVKLDVNKAVRYLSKACDLGNTEACKLLGINYFRGEAVGKNLNKSIYFLSKACENRDMESCLILGSIYLNSNYRDEGLKFFNKQCKSGNSKSCNVLAIMYLKGEGVKKDVKKALKYLSKT